MYIKLGENKGSNKKSKTEPNWNTCPQDSVKVYMHLNFPKETFNKTPSPEPTLKFVA